MSEISVMPVATLHAGRILDGRKTALLAPAVPADHYLLDGTWYARDDGFEHGRVVQTVEHFGGQHGIPGYTTTTGGIVSIRALPSRNRIKALVTEIRMVECIQLTEAEMIELGYPDRAAYMAEAGLVMQHRKAWFIRIVPLLPAAAQ